jgi:hypothetical protein
MTDDNNIHSKHVERWLLPAREAAEHLFTAINEKALVISKASGISNTLGFKYLIQHDWVEDVDDVAQLLEQRAAAVLNRLSRRSAREFKERVDRLNTAYTGYGSSGAPYIAHETIGVEAVDAEIYAVERAFRSKCGDHPAHEGFISSTGKPAMTIITVRIDAPDGSGRTKTYRYDTSKGRPQDYNTTSLDAFAGLPVIARRTDEQLREGLANVVCRAMYPLPLYRHSRTVALAWLTEMAKRNLLEFDAHENKPTLSFGWSEEG